MQQERSGLFLWLTYRRLQRLAITAAMSRCPRDTSPRILVLRRSLLRTIALTQFRSSISRSCLNPSHRRRSAPSWLLPASTGASSSHSVDAYASETRELAYRLLELMAKAVGAEPPAVLLGVFQGQPQGMRVNYYPPCRQAADRVLGLSPHTDAGGLTLLLQMDNAAVDGLQIKKDGKWFSVNVVDGAFVVNVGDALEIMSNGKFTSVEHRAVIHPAKERISAAMFFYPCPHMMVGPLPEFVKGDKERYGSTSYEDFMKHYFATKLDGRKHLERLKLEQ
ncbi:hypothetical protein SORBI_3001G366200 [Sorghum bicolor]|uniref:Fe2OG dioxygenase domain-containing protein n=1 Tax=Sorghum bicolor TaxID=4558 RepID=A0A1Z5SA04_SORBI|nr:hypothetical protein SORBI_3001G366200 [Sorghum bicolor]